MAEKKTFQIEIEGKSVRELRKELKGLKDDLASATDPENMIALARAAAEVQDKLADVNEQVKVFASGSEFEQAGNALGNVKNALTSLDFGKAQDRAKAFATAAGSITFKGAITSVKQLGSTFMSLAKTLVTNPLFIIGAVIALVVVGIYKLLDSLGYIQVAMDLLGKAMDWIIGLFKSLTDWMGISSFAAQDAADATAKAYEDSAARQVAAQQRVVQGLDNRIRLAQLEGKDVTELEREKRAELEKTAKMEYQASQARFEASLLNKKLTREEIAEIKEKARQSRLAYEQSLADTQYFEAQIRVTKQKEADKAVVDEIKANDTASKAAEAKAKEAAAKRKAFADNRLKAERAIKDAELEMVVDGLDKEIAVNQEKYARLIEDTKKSETLLQSEKDLIISQFEKIRAQKEKEIRDKKIKEDTDAQIAAQLQLNALMLSTNENGFILQKAQIEQQQAERLTLLQKQLADGLITKEQFDAAEIALEAEKQRKLNELKGLKEDAKTPKEEADEEINILKQKLAAGIISETEYADEIERINAELNEKIQAADAKTYKEKLDQASAHVAKVQDGLSAISNLMQIAQEAELNNAEGNEAAQEAIRKKSFDKNKKMQLAQAMMGTAQSIISGMGAPFPMSVALPIIAGATGLANIAKIRSTSYQGGGGGTPSTPKASMPNISTPQRMGPNVNFQSNQNANNQVGAGGTQPMNITLQNQVSVSAVEMTSVQNSNATLAHSAEL